MVRFDKPCIKVAGAVAYFREHLAIGDYLSEEGKAEMTWFGTGAERLGLEGACRLDDFENVCRGFHPKTGERLSIRDKGPQRRVCFFGQISPPKDVSLLHLVGGDTRIAGWWDEAVKETLREMEAVAAARVRSRGANADRPTRNLVATLVTHDASRSLDPQLHTHVCILNATFDKDHGRWKSLQPSGLYRHQGYFREVCYNKLAERLTEAGYTLESARGLGFTIAGVPAELRERFSKRRRAILAQAHALGSRTQDALQRIASDSRDAKTTATAASLRSRWETEAGEHLQELRDAIAKADGRKPPAPLPSPHESILSAEAHVFERHSVIDDRLLLREALIAGRGRVPLDALKRALRAREEAGELLRSGDELASRAALDAEREYTGWAASQTNAHAPLGRPASLAKLGPDQKRAVRGVLASPSGIVILQGDAGTGKTRSLREIVAGIERSGGRVFGCAPSAGATDVLRHELTADAETLQLLLVSEDLQRRVHGRTLIVDEAGFVSTREMRDLCRLAGRNANRLLLVGDVKQHHSVEAGDALRCLQEYARVPVFRLTQIRRQTDAAFRKAVAQLAEGDALGAFNAFERLGAVQEEKTAPALFAAAATDYVRTVQSGATCLAISPVWEEIHGFTAEVRRQLRAAQRIGPDEQTRTTVSPLKWTQEERRRIANYHPGDILSFHGNSGAFQKHDSAVVLKREGNALLVRRPDGREHRLDPRRASGYSVGLAQTIPLARGDRLLIRANLKSANLKNGDLVEIASFAPDGSLHLQDGRSIPSWFQEFSHGYATTSHASQGKTVDRGLLFMGEAGIAAGNLKQAYVSNSRFRLSQRIFTTDKEAAREAMARPADRKLARELLRDSPEALPRRRWRALWAAQPAETLKPKAA